MSTVNLWEIAALDVRPDLTEERRMLLGLVRSLSAAEWHAPTAVPGWTVKGLALHLLDDDLGWLSRGRDGDSSGRLPESVSFVQALADKNQRWVDGAQGLSLPVVAGLLEWAGEQMDAYYASMDLRGEGSVSWASDERVPIWFDIAQDLTERWVHQMQMREAIGRVEGYRAAFLPTVLRIFVWALPHQYAAQADAGTTVGVDLAAGGTWHLERTGTAWTLHEGAATSPAAAVQCSDEAAWLWLTGGEVPAGGMRFDGPAELWRPLLAVRGILA